MDFSVALVGLVVLLFLSYRHVKAEMKKLDVGFKGYLRCLKARLEPFADNLFVALISAMAISLVISLVSFRQVWSNDVFHVVFVAALLRTHVERIVRIVF